MKFSINKKYIKNEFQEANWDINSGLSPEQLSKKIEGYINKAEGMPMELLRANIFKIILENAQIEINPNTIFADKINTGVSYETTASPDIYERVVFQPIRDRVLRENCKNDYEHMLSGKNIGVGFAWTDFWHTVPDWNNIISLGFVGILNKAIACKEAKINEGSITEKERNFYDGVIISFKAIISYLHRLYNASLNYNIPEYSKAILHLTKRAPETLYQVMLMSVLYVYMEEIGCERARSLGPIDVLYYPYYKKELENDTPIDEIKSMFQYFFIHFDAAKRFAQQPFVLGGCDIDGNDRTNELSMLILDWYDELNIFNPKIHIRYHKNINKNLMLKALNMIRHGNSSICILNDEVVFKGYEKIGIPLTDAVNYVPLGCYEPIIMGKEEAEIGAAWLNMSKAIEFTFSGGRDIKTGIQLHCKTPDDFSTFDEFYKTFIYHADEIVSFAMKHILQQGMLSTQINPSPIYSATFTQCLERGMDVHEWPLEYNNVSVKCFGLATVVDSLMMVKKYVFDLKEVTYTQMREAILNNWKGYEELRVKIKKDDGKYGNNLDEPDRLMKDIVDHFWDLLENRETGRNGVFRLGTDSIFYNVKMGNNTWATPDGRCFGDPVSKNLTATGGQDRNGITGLMNSLTKLEQDKNLDSAVLDFVLHPSAVQGDKGLEAFYNLIRVYFKNGGTAVQGNIMDIETLKKAQENPEEYKTLQIRVCGWNEYFVDMSPEMQATFINE